MKQQIKTPTCFYVIPKILQISPSSRGAAFLENLKQNSRNQIDVELNKNIIADRRKLESIEEESKVIETERYG